MPVLWSRSRGSHAWLALGCAVLAYEVVAPSDQLLTASCARGLERHPLLTRAAIVITAAHLLRVIPSSLDPYNQAEAIIRRRN